MGNCGQKNLTALRTPVLAGPYQSREVSDLGIIEIDGWRFKIYGIHAPERPTPTLGWLPVVRKLIRERLHESGGYSERYGVGFGILHHGREANFLIDWWVGENMLENHVHVSPLENPEAFEYVSPSGLSACVWELEVMSFERKAWIETVLDRPQGPDLEAYLERRLEGKF